jgi:hypothetical protein
MNDAKSHEYMDWPQDMGHGLALRTLQRIEEALRQAGPRLEVQQLSHNLYRIVDTDDGTETRMYHRVSDALLEWSEAHSPDLPMRAGG